MLLFLCSDELTAGKIADGVSGTFELFVDGYDPTSTADLIAEEIITHTTPDGGKEGIDEVH